MFLLLLRVMRYHLKVDSMLDYIKNTGTGFAAATAANVVSNEKFSMIWLAVISAGTQIVLKWIEFKKRKTEYGSIKRSKVTRAKDK